MYFYYETFSQMEMVYVSQTSKERVLSFSVTFYDLSLFFSQANHA